MSANYMQICTSLRMSVLTFVYMLLVELCVCFAAVDVCRCIFKLSGCVTWHGLPNEVFSQLLGVGVCGVSVSCTEPTYHR